LIFASFENNGAGHEYPVNACLKMYTEALAKRKSIALPLQIEHQIVLTRSSKKVIARQNVNASAKIKMFLRGKTFNYEIARFL
jgi:hypothetical protein